MSQARQLVEVVEIEIGVLVEQWTGAATVQRGCSPSNRPGRPRASLRDASSRRECLGRLNRSDPPRRGLVARIATCKR